MPSEVAVQHEYFSPSLEFFGSPIQYRYRDEDPSYDEHDRPRRDVNHEEATEEKDDVLYLGDDVLSVEDDVLPVDDD